MSDANRSNIDFHAKDKRIVVVGASGRALAASCLRARRPVSVIDLFADIDTIEICQRSNRYLSPDHAANFVEGCETMAQIVARVAALLEDAAFQMRYGDPLFLVAGGLENWLRQFRHRHAMRAGLNTRAYAETGSFRAVERFCRVHGICFPNSSTRRHATNHWGQTIVKTDFSSGGSGVGPARVNDPLETGQYFQQYVHGQPISGCYVGVAGGAANAQMSVDLVGICQPVPSHPKTGQGNPTEQLAFRYSGSVGPIATDRLPIAVVKEFRRAGQLAAEYFHLTGVFGIDFILQRDCLWLLEINPRVTASVEVLEDAAQFSIPGFSVAQLHLNALQGNIGRLPFNESQEDTARTIGGNVDRWFAKQIVYRRSDAATEVLQITQPHLDALAKLYPNRSKAQSTTHFPATTTISDIPRCKTDICAGQPILTVHVSGHSQTDVGLALESAVKQIGEVFAEPLSS